MNKILPLLLAVFFCTETFAAGPVLWGPYGSANISSGPVYDQADETPYLKKSNPRDYVVNPNAALNTAGWTVEAGSTLERRTGSSNPRPEIGTYFYSSGNSMVYQDIIIDPIDLNKDFVVSASVATTSVGSGFAVRRNSADNCSGSWTVIVTGTANATPYNQDIYRYFNTGNSRCYRLSINTNTIGGTAINAISFKPVEPDQPGYSGNNFYYQNFENSTSASTFVTYNSGSADPGTGTGGTANLLTASRITNDSLILDGSASLTLSKSSGDALGQGASVEFTVPPAYRQGSSYALEFLFGATGSFYESNGFKVYIYDVTNGVLITPRNNGIPKGQGPMQIAWDASDATTYRLIFHIDTSVTQPFSLRLDNIRIWPGEVIPVPASHGAITFTPVYEGSTTNPTIGSGATNFGWYSRNSDGSATLHYEFGAANAGTAGDGLYIIKLPPGLTISSVVGSAGSGSRGVLGTATVNLGTGQALIGNVHRYDASGDSLIVKLESNSFWGSTSTQNFSAANLRFSIHAPSVPIAEWADSPMYAANASQAVVNTVAVGTGTQTITAATSGNITFLTNITDNVGGGSWSNGEFTVPQSGYYQASGGVTFGSVTQVSNARNTLRVTGSTSGTYPIARTWTTSANTEFNLDGSRLVKLVAGETVRLTWATGSALTATLSSDNVTPAYFSLTRVYDEYGRPVVGFGYVTQDSSGLVKRAGQLLGTNTNDNADAGNVGEFFSDTSSGTFGPSPSWTGDMATITLTPGDWDVSGSFCYRRQTSTVYSESKYVCLENSNATSCSASHPFFILNGSQAPTSAGYDCYTVGPGRVSISGNVTYYLKAQVSYSSGGAPTYSGYVQARRAR